MRNTLNDLNNALFQELEELQDEELSEDALDRRIRRSESVCKVADRIISNAELALNVVKCVNEYGIDEGITGRYIPNMLTGEKDDQ